MTDRRARIRGYALCLGTVAVAAAVAIFFSYLSGRPSHSLAAFYLAVLVTALYAGREAGLVCVVLSALAGALLLEPVGSLGVAHVDDAVALAAFVVVGVLFVLICQRMRGALRLAEEAGPQMKRVEERFRIAQELSPSGFGIFRALRQGGGGPITDFVVEYINPAGVRMGKYGSAQRVIDRRLSEVSPGSMRQPRLFPMYCRCIETSQPEEVELWFESERATGWYHVQTVPMGDDRIAVSYSDITSQRELLASERAARSEAERASRLKDEFLATLSHELRTPLNAILGWAQLLQPEQSDKQDLQLGIATIERNARAQKQIIEDLLDMSRIIAGKIRLEVQPTNLHSVINAAVESVHHAAEAKDICLKIAMVPNPGRINADPARLQQVVWNLLTNAIKFTPKHGQITIELSRLDSLLQISVSDSGQGIKPEFLPHIFERFRQQDATTTRRHGGLGLGLSIVKQLVELHGGTVRAESEGDGKGARFIVSVPLQESMSEGAAAPDGLSEGGIAREAILLEGLKLLVVDDEPDARELIGRVLREAGAEVFAAASADAALGLLAQHRPDVMLSDIGMPDRDGYQLIREIRALPVDRGGNTPALALTAFARSEDRTRAMRAGYQVHVSKPIDRQELVAAVASLAGLGGTRRMDARPAGGKMVQVQK